uniref:Uncharacterized protein n=1 Tax=Arundo donax TaxID=35708 RepID=A0A0A9HTS2_ARUDO
MGAAVPPAEWAPPRHLWPHHARAPAALRGLRRLNVLPCRAPPRLASHRAAVHPGAAAPRSCVAMGATAPQADSAQPYHERALSPLHPRYAATAHPGVTVVACARGSPQLRRVGGGRGEVEWPAPRCLAWRGRTWVPPSLPKPQPQHGTRSRYARCRRGVTPPVDCNHARPRRLQSCRV